MAISSLNIQETLGILRHNELVRIGIPFAKGEFTNASDILLKDYDKTIITQKKILQHWSDGSIRWLLVDFLANLSPHQKKEYQISMGKDDTHNASIPSNISWQVNTSKQHFLSLSYKNVNYNISCIISKKNNNFAVNLELKHTNRGKICTSMLFTGTFQNKVKVSLNVDIFANNVQGKITIHNSRRAKHKGGIWDLGDKGSFLFDSFVVKIDTTILKATTNIVNGDFCNFNIYQNSSGGKNWNSINHVDHKEQVTTSFCGFHVYENNKKIWEGKRAQPCITLHHTGFFSNIALENFWQNFPKAISIDKDSLTLHLFPKSQYPFELQGGEQKTHTFHMAFDKDLVLEKLIPLLAKEYYASTNTIDFFTTQQTEIDEYIQEAVHGKNSFTKRNEMMDEYGWRNFGDFFADHEAINSVKDKFVSHYNNQYDLIYGFFLQYARTGKKSWFDLMSNLAQHVMDIDIYRTNSDKPAYNNGLFWHTNHYLPAATATHRCYSKFHLQQVKYPKAYGGGPSNEHNYTTGLLYFYLITGNEQAKEAVLLLANWVLNMEDGKKNILSLVDQSDTGLSSQTYSPSFHGPGRGSGNSINALVDAYTITNKKSYLAAAEKLIRRCIHPQDCIEKMNLTQPEQRWSYTVFLQILGKYIACKEEQGTYDDVYHYAIASLRHYAHWMINNEYFYLDKPQKLEYPTETWAAQELRKVHVFFLASLYEKNTAFEEKMHFFYRRAISTLNTDYQQQKNFVRPVAILMHWGNIYHYALLNKRQVKVLSEKSFAVKENFVPQKQKVKYKIKKIVKITGCVVFLFFMCLVIHWLFFT